MSNWWKCPLEWLEWLTQRATDFVSSPWGTISALGVIGVWLGLVPSLGWAGAWAVVDEVVFASSFLLLFLLQRGQTKATFSMQIKLNELLAAEHRASHQLINIEDRPEEEVHELHGRYQQVQERGPGSHSIGEDVNESRREAELADLGPADGNEG